MKKYILGLDVGGTKTFAAICDNVGNLLGTGKSGAGNFNDVGI